MSHPVPTLALALLLAPVAAAQLDLPDKQGKDTTPPGLKDPKTGDIAPHLTCTVCYVANYTTKIDWEAEQGLQQAYCGVCQAARLHYVPRQGGKKGGSGIDLPGAPRRAPGAAPVVDQPEQGAPVLRQDPLEDGLTHAAREILIALDRAESVDDPVALQAGETLLSLGGPGRVAARLALADEHAPKMLTGVRVLLRTGVAEDAEVVVARLRRRMPTRAAASAVSELIALDPVHATPRLLCELLDHPQQPVRAAAQRALRGAKTDDVLPFLVPQLESERGDTRMRAVDLMAGMEHPAKGGLLMTRLDDPRAKVARRVVEVLAGVEDPTLDTQLLALAFGERWVLRPGAYALLALMEREDAGLRAILHEQHAEALLRGLGASDPFVSGTCAAALAGIGFRSESATVSSWLDGPVPERLVRVVSGFEFFDDYEALRETALRRLKQVTGASFGANGPAWAEWWIAGRGDFVASRAVVPIVEGDERRLHLAVSNRTTGESFVLVGPDRAPSAPIDRGEVFYLGPVEALELLTFLQSQGVFDLERLPGTRGALSDRGRVVDVRVGDRGKSFVFGSGASEAWFDRVVGRAQALAERNHWQRFPHPEVHGDRLALYRTEGAWWSGDHDALQRAARLKELILARVRALPVGERDPELAALTSLYRDPVHVESADFPVLLGLLGEERWFGGRARDIARLARSAAGLRDTAPEAEVGVRLGLLVDCLHETFSAEAMPELADLIAAAGSEFARAAAADARPILRAVSAHALADGPSDEDLAVLDTLLRDPVVDVEVAAVEALGRGRVESLRTEVLLRARLGKADVRIAALAAIGRLGGPDVRDILTTSLTDSDERFRLAAVRGLANLADPSTAPLLVSLLRTRSTAGTAPIVRAALLDLGPAAHDELFLSMRSPSPELQRECSLLLARQSVSAAAPVLMEVLSGNPVDKEVARELTILTCTDLRGQIDPAEAWFSWWDGVKHDDSRAWLRAAAEARNIPAPPAEAFRDGASRDVIGFLVEVMRLPEEHLAERARRELEARIGRQVEDLPPHGPRRNAWLLALLEVLDEQR